MADPDEIDYGEPPSSLKKGVDRLDRKGGPISVTFENVLPQLAQDFRKPKRSVTGGMGIEPFTQRVATATAVRL
jgi:hypothetical protein